MSDQNNGASFRVGSVISRSFSIYFGNFVPFTLTAMLLISPATIIGLFIGFGDLDSSTASVLSVGNGAANFVLGSIIAGALVYAAFEAIKGNSPSIGGTISQGLRAAIAVIIVSILMGLLIGAGFVLLIIPGVFALVVLAVTVPATVVEKPGIIAAMERSKQLTKGYRWQILGVFVLYAIIISVVTGAMGALIAFSVMSSGAEVSSGLILGAAAIDWVLTGVMAALNATLIAVMYHDLRTVKEGVGIEELAAVFD